jgi:hypothetical protein
MRRALVERESIVLVWGHRSVGFDVKLVAGCWWALWWGARLIL